MVKTQLDALVVGTGFGGIYQLKRLLEMGLNVIAIDFAPDVGGTWYWNRYPGAMSDTESYIYRYSWDKEDLIQSQWKDHYLKQPEILAYLNGVVQKFDLRKHMKFNVEMKSAVWDDETNHWTVETASGDVYDTRYLCTCMGLLSSQNFPNIPGLSSFKGELYHTSRWPRDSTLKDKRVGVIGSGSTGVQIISALSKSNEMSKLISFQRNPQYSVPSGDKPMDPVQRADINQRYPDIWNQVNNSFTAFGFEESTRPTFSVDPEERERLFEEAWERGNGFKFMFGTFGDIASDPEANKAAADFIKGKIRTIVKDQDKARKLLPSEIYARRPLCDSGYYDSFNNPKVDIIDLRETPIDTITENGIRTSDGINHEVDVLVFATGFDAVSGTYNKLNIVGKDGETLKDHWSYIGPTSYIGLNVAGFPNLFTINGPNGPFTNQPPGIEAHVDFATDLMTTAQSKVEGDGKGRVEVTQEAEKGWINECEELSKDSLFRQTSSWIFGKNIEGKKLAAPFWFGGMKGYNEKLEGLRKEGYKPAYIVL